jgi:hypothetical protein
MITIAMLCVALLPVFVLSSTLVKQAYQTSRTNALRELELLAGDAANRAEQEIRLLWSRMDLLAQNSDMELAIRSLTFIERADRLVRDFQRDNLLVQEVWFVSSLGDVVAAAPVRVEMLVVPADIESVVRSTFQDRSAVSRGSVAPQFLSCRTRDDKPALCLYVPVFGAMGDAVGLIATQISFPQIASLSFTAAPSTVGYRILGENNEVVFRRNIVESKAETRFWFRAPVVLRAVERGIGGPNNPLFVVELSESEKNRLRPVDEMMMTMGLYILFVLLGVVGVSLLVSRWLLTPIRAMTRLVSSYGEGAFSAKPDAVSFSEFQSFMRTLDDLGERLQFYMERVAADAARESALKRSVAEAELQTLKNQMKPHFLFNALNNVLMMMSIDAVRAQKLLLKLSDLYRLILLQTEKVVIPLEDELAIVENFLELQSVRFQNRLRYSIVADVDKRRVNIPGLVLQTLVENALKHGIEPAREGGSVEVRIGSAPEGSPLPYVVEVFNTGQPLVKTTGEGKGLENTRRRLTLIDGPAHQFSIEATPQGTRVRFFFSGRTYETPAS